MKKTGFTLVELSIVLVIIGILIGGILVAQSMIDTARMVRIIKQSQEIKIMTDLFVERNKCIPGDCTAPHIPAAQRGNANLTIDPYVEDITFAYHLKLMGLYDTPTNLSGCDLFFTKNCFMPGPEKNSIFTVRYFLAGVNLRFDHGPFYMANMRLGENWLNYGLWDSVTTGAGPLSPADILTPAQAMAIDKKEDDGNPATGSVRGNAEDILTSDNLNCLTGENNTPGVRYDLSKTAPGCTVFFYLQYYGNFEPYY